MQFRLFDAAESGTQIPGTGAILQGPISVSNGLFTTVLNFGGGTVFNGSPRWLEIRVLEESESDATLLTPRQPILPTPYAITAGNLAGTLPESKLPSNVPRLNTNQVLDVAGAVAINGTTIIDAAGNWIAIAIGLSLTNV